MYNLLFVEICGLFTPLHFLTIALFFTLLILALLCSRRLDLSKAQRILLWQGIVITVLEVIKIFTRIYRGQWPDSWMPLYYCSLFIFAVWMIQSRLRAIQRAGYAFITMGGILASVFFTFYPSTSLATNPLISFSSIHSFYFHFVMCYCGILILWKGIYRPQKRDSLYYFIFVTCACVLAVLSNHYLGTNCMFLEHPYELPLLQPILEYSKPLYMLLVTFAQACLIFWLNFGIFKLLSRRKTAR